MRPLCLILATAEPARFRSATAIAAAQAALGAVARMHLDTGAVAALADPALRDAVAEAQGLGVTVSLCPTGLADHGVDPAVLPGAESFGLVALLAELPDDARLVMA